MTTACPTCGEQVRIVFPAKRGSVPINGDPVYAWHARLGTKLGTLGPNAGFCPGSRTTVATAALDRAV